MMFSIRISAEDFSSLFDVVELCSVNPDTLVEGNTPASPSSPSSTSIWTISEHEGLWAPGSSAGGSRKYNSMLMTLYYVFNPTQIIPVVIYFFLIFFYSESFWKNPQFQLVLTEKDHSDEDGAVEVEVEDEDEDEDDEGEDDEDDEPMTQEEKKRAEKQKQKAKQCTVLVELLQKNRRQKDKINFLYVGFHIYKVTSPRLLPF